MPVKIRPIRPADIAAWRGLRGDYLEFYGASVSDAIYVSTFARLLGDDDHDLCALIAVQDGVIVGLVHYLFHRHCWRIENDCYLQDLFVAPSLRGTGAGRKLIEAIYTAADAAGTPSVYWMSQDDNAAGRQLYDRVGDLTNFIKYQRSAA